jgi:hypothetical protein
MSDDAGCALAVAELFGVTRGAVTADPGDRPASGPTGGPLPLPHAASVADVAITAALAPTRIATLVRMP